MPIDVSVQAVSPRMLAVVRRKVRINEIADSWRPALDQVWEFLKQHPGLHTGGQNVFLYHHPANMESPMDADFGVEVTRAFESVGEVFSTATPSGEVAGALHLGPYQRLGETHGAIHAWAAAHKRSFAGKSWEIYGDWTDRVAELKTRVEYLLL
jgi:effector-binding domain-containing protein